MPKSNTPDNNVLVRVENVGKKFCRDLKKSLWYGMKDIGSELLPGERDLERHATLRPGEFWAVEGVSFELRRGECLGLIGRNGAGKTTLLKMLNGLIKPDKGRIEIRGRVGALIALGAGFNPILTGRENIYVNGAVLGLAKRETDAKLEEIIEFAELGDFIDAPVQSYSSGMVVRLGFAVATAMHPSLLLLDEVLAVGDMDFQAKCFNRIAEIRSSGIATILVSHNMHQISRFAEKVLFLSGGLPKYLGQSQKGIERYLASCDNERREQGLTSSGVGTLAVTIERPCFLNAAGARTEEILAGDPLSIHIPFRIWVPVCPPLNVEVILRTRSGDPFFHSSSGSLNVAIEPEASHGAIRFDLEAVPANNIHLALSVMVWTADTSRLLYWQKGSPEIFVRGPALSIGLVGIKNTCRLLRADMAPDSIDLNKPFSGMSKEKKSNLAQR